MANIKLIPILRERTGAGMMDCRKALDACNDDVEKAIDWLRENGIAKAAKKSGRIAAEGLIGISIADKKASIVEINTETDFVAKNPDFVAYVQDVSNEALNTTAQDLDSFLASSWKNGDKTVNDVLTEQVATIGEKISFRRFTRIVKEDNQVFGTYSHMGGRIATLVLLNGSNEEVAKEVAATTEKVEE